LEHYDSLRELSVVLFLLDWTISSPKLHGW
jgi:hypothetical protein